MPRSTPNQIYKVVKTADNRFEKKDYKKSLEGYKKALSMRPNKEIESHCYLKIGLSLQFLKNYPDALAAFDKSLSIQRSFMGFFYRGILNMSLQRFKEAEDDLKHSLKNNTKDSNALVAYVNLGRIYVIEKKTKDALKVLKSALEINENDISALLLLGETYKDINEIENAKTTYEKILSHSQNRDAIIGLGSIYLETKEEQKAISLLKNYLQNHQDPELLKIKGEIHFSLNDYENALKSFNKARKITNSESLIIREARCLIALKQIDEAFTIVENYLNNNKKAILSKVFLAELYSSSNQKSKASEILNELIQTEQAIQTNASLCQTVANVLLLNNELDKAENLFLKANELGLQNWLITKQLVIISLEKQNYSVALERVELLFSLAENSSQIGHSYHLKATIYYKQEMYHDAQKTIDEGINELKKVKNEQYFLLSLLLAKVYAKSDNNNEAKKVIDNILKENASIRNIISADVELQLFLD